jgi:hypothetical protein
MLDRDLAQLYQVETKVLNQAVKRNRNRFPESFMFQLTPAEFKHLKSQFVTSSWGGVRKRPFVFTEHGCLQASNVLKSPSAIQISLFIIDAFVTMKNQSMVNPSYELLKERVKRLEAAAQLADARAQTLAADMRVLKKDHDMDMRVQNMEINDLNDKVTDLLRQFNRFRDASIVIKKDGFIGRG